MPPSIIASLWVCLTRRLESYLTSENRFLSSSCIRMIFCLCFFVSLYMASSCSIAPKKGLGIYTKNSWITLTHLSNIVLSLDEQVHLSELLLLYVALLHDIPLFVFVFLAEMGKHFFLLDWLSGSIEAQYVVLSSQHLIHSFLILGLLLIHLRFCILDLVVVLAMDENLLWIDWD